MKLSVASHYAIRALVSFAREKPDALAPAREVASAEGVSRPSLLNVLTPLVDAGILRSHTGGHGRALSPLGRHRGKRQQTPPVAGQRTNALPASPPR